MTPLEVIGLVLLTAAGLFLLCLYGVAVTLWLLRKMFRS